MKMIFFFRKNGEWEKNRRDKLNLTFSELSQLLPGHDPLLTLSKVEILRKTVAYVGQLRESNTRLLETNCDAALSESTLISLKAKRVISSHLRIQQ